MKLVSLLIIGRPKVSGDKGIREIPRPYATLGLLAQTHRFAFLKEFGMQNTQRKKGKWIKSQKGSVVEGRL